MTDEIKKIRPDFTGYSETTDEKLTFFGVLNRFYIYDIEGTKSRVGGISRNWNAESTRKANKNNYEKVIFPRIPNIPLEEMTKDDFDEIIQSIIRAGGRGGCHRHQIGVHAPRTRCKITQPTRTFGVNYN